MNNEKNEHESNLTEPEPLSGDRDLDDVLLELIRAVGVVGLVVGGEMTAQQAGEILAEPLDLEQYVFTGGVLKQVLEWDEGLAGNINDLANLLHAGRVAIEAGEE